MPGSLPQGLCIDCGVNKQMSAGKRKDGTTYYTKLCTSCNRKKYRPGYSYLSIEKSHCCCCGFVPVHPCQLDVEHIDGNHKNNDKRNLQVLCANCHRLKTFLNNDSVK